MHISCHISLVRQLLCFLHLAPYHNAVPLPWHGTHLIMIICMRLFWRSALEEQEAALTKRAKPPQREDPFVTALEPLVDRNGGVSSVAAARKLPALLDMAHSTPLRIVVLAVRVQHCMGRFWHNNQQSHLQADGVESFSETLRQPRSLVTVSPVPLQLLTFTCIPHEPKTSAVLQGLGVLCRGVISLHPRRPCMSCKSLL